jgi:hypothetical protein
MIEATDCLITARCEGVPPGITSQLRVARVFPGKVCNGPMIALQSELASPERCRASALSKSRNALGLMVLRMASSLSRNG